MNKSKRKDTKYALYHFRFLSSILKKHTTMPTLTTSEIFLSLLIIDDCGFILAFLSQPQGLNILYAYLLFMCFSVSLTHFIMGF